MGTPAVHIIMIMRGVIPNARVFTSGRRDLARIADAKHQGSLPYTTFATNFTNSATSSSVVSNEHIQRTMHSSSIHG